MSLKTDYRDDIYEGSRRWRITPNEDGTSTITDATTYTQKGDKFGQNDVNAITSAINRANRPPIPVTLPASGWSATAPHIQTARIPELMASDNPLMVMAIPDEATSEQAKAYKKAFGMIDGGNIADGQATFRCYNNKPTIDITVGLKGV